MFKSQRIKIPQLGNQNVINSVSTQKFLKNFEIASVAQLASASVS